MSEMGNCDRFMAIRWKCMNCEIELSGEGAPRHYLSYPHHKLIKLPPLPLPKPTTPATSFRTATTETVA